LDGRVHAFGGLSDVRKVYTHKSWPVDMQKLNEEGNAYLDSTFPEMTRLVSASVIETWAERKLLVPKRGGELIVMEPVELPSRRRRMRRSAARRSGRW